MKKYIYYAFGILCLALAGLRLYNTPAGGLFTSAVRTKPAAARKAEAERIYKVSFAFKNGGGRVSAFLPRYETKSYDEALETAARFGMGVKDLAREDASAWTFEKNSESVTIGKRLNTITYRSSKAEANGAPGAVPEETAKAFADERGLRLPREETRTADEGGATAVYFIGKVGSLPDYAFPVQIIVAGGAVVSMEYAEIGYERLAPCELITMREAYERLPTEGGETSVDLKRAALVYRFADSILQPAYLFEGETSGGGRFERYVPAGVFGR